MTLVAELRPGADRVGRLTPLGLRFWDAFERRFVCDHALVVTARRPGTPGSPLTGTITTSGVYAFHGLPGMRDVEQGTGDEAFWAANPPAHPFELEVVDLAGRFQPFTMPLQAPVKGVVRWQCGTDVFSSPPAPEDAAPVPLLSAPTRAVTPPHCAVRAELWDATDPVEARWRPAAWAVLEVRFGGALRARSFADAAGRVLVPFAFPELAPETPIDSPLSATGPSPPPELAVELAVRWQPGATTTRPPPLCATLSQAPARLWFDIARTVQLTTTTLRMSEQAILVSRDTATGRRTSRLLVTA